MDTSEFSEDGTAQAEGTAGGYWPADQAMRLECLRMAADVDPQHAVEKATEFYNFVQGMVDIKPTSQSN